MTDTATPRKSRRTRGVAVDLLVPLSRGQEALRDQARRLLERELPTAQARRAIETGSTFDPELWRELAELEWLGILVPERHGGAEGTVGDVCILAEQMGRVLLPGPFLATAVLGATTLRGSADELAAIAAGSLRVGVATTGRVTAVAGVATRASGSATGVLDAAGADVIVLAAADEAGTPLVVRARPGEGVAVAPEPSIDGTRRTSIVELDDAVVDVLAFGAAAEALLGEAETLGTIFLAAELAGCASRCLELSVDYAKARTQFGRPIGSYQAVKHKCVDMLVSIEAARAAVRYAARLADTGEADRHVMARVARIQANAALVQAAAWAMHIHGGSGFTWDNDAHLYLKRGKASERLLGEPWRHRRAIARILGVSRGEH